MCEFLLKNKEECNSLDLTYSGFMSMQIKLRPFPALFFFLLACVCAPAHAQSDSPQTLQFTVFHTMEHDSARFTQGLAISGEKIFEGTGLNGFSTVFESDLKTGKILKMRKNAQNIFGEGVTLLHDRVYQLSWRNGNGFIYDLDLKPLGEFKIDTEGWGLTTDGAQLILSDGSSTLYWLDEKTRQVVKRITVHEGLREISQLNELEYANGFVYANIWHADVIAVINPDDGAVRAWIDLSALKKGFMKPPGWNEREHVLNGIAYDPASGHFFVTGKCWPAMFELLIETPKQ